MQGYYFTFRSVTLAQHGQRVLERNGINGYITRSPQWMEAQGCGYRMRVTGASVDTIVSLFKRNNVKFSKIYLEAASGYMEEIFV